MIDLLITGDMPEIQENAPVAWVRSVALPHRTVGFQGFLNPLAEPGLTEVLQGRVNMPAIPSLPFGLSRSLK